MKLTVVTNLFPNPTEPTRGIFNFQQFTRLAEHVELTVLVPVSWLRYWRNPQIRHTDHWENIKVQYFPFYYPPGFARSSHGVCLIGSLYAGLQQFFKPENCDVIYACWGYPDAFAAAYLAKRYQRSLIVKCHGSDVNIIPNYRMRCSQLLWGISQAKQVIVVSAALKQQLTKLCVPPEKIAVIYNGVDPSLFYPCQTEAISKTNKLVLFIGRLTHEKGALDLFSAFLPLAQADSSLHLHYIGEGDLAPIIAKGVKQANVHNQVQITPSISHADLNYWYNRASVICLPSQNEGVPNVLLEAMATGTPVVATNVGGIPEIISNDTGLLVPPSSPQSLTIALGNALNRHWEKTTISRHAQSFDWGTNVQSLLELLHH